MSLSDRETAEGFAGGHVPAVATLHWSDTRDVLLTGDFAGGTSPAVATLDRAKMRAVELVGGFPVSY
jgi:hypothetical protein